MLRDFLGKGGRIRKMFDADGGGTGGGDDGSKDKVVFTDEQQTHLQSLIDKAYSKAYSKATADLKQQKEEQEAELQNINKEKQLLMAEKAKTTLNESFKKDNLLLPDTVKDADKTNAKLLEVFANMQEEQRTEVLTLFKTFIKELSTIEVDKRLGEKQEKPPKPEQTNTINDILRKQLQGI